MEKEKSLITGRKSSSGGGSGLFGAIKRVIKTAVKISIPLINTAIPFTVEAVMNKACGIIREKLDELFRRTVINSIVTLVLNTAGLLTAFFRPFGEVVSRYLAAAFFLSAIILFIVRTFRFIKENGRMTFSISKNIILERSVSRGIEDYVLKEFPAVCLAYTGISIAEKYLPSLRTVPSIREAAGFFIKMFWKRVAVFAGVLALYTVSVYFIARPILIENLVRLKWYEIYFYPVYHIAGCIRGAV